MTVRPETPLLDTSSASIGHVVDSRTIMELPLKDGMVLTMATLAPGVIFTPESAGIRPHHTSPPREVGEFADFCALMVGKYC